MNLNNVMTESVAVTDCVDDEAFEEAVHRPGPFSRILVVLDGSEWAEQVLKQVEPLAERFHAHVTLVRVLSPFESVFHHEIMSGTYKQGQMPMEEESARESATLYLRAIAQHLIDAGIETSYRCLGGKRPADVIVQYAQDTGMDLIALTALGRGGASGAAVGSTAQQVLHSSPCPVLLTGTEARASQGLVASAHHTEGNATS